MKTMIKNESSAPITSIHYDDSYYTRQHAFNIGLAYGTVCAMLSLCIVVVFGIRAVWLLRGVLVSMLIGVSAFAVSLINFTNEARDIQWKTNVPSEQIVDIEPHKDANLVPKTNPNALRAYFPSPNHSNGMLFTDVALTEDQRVAIANTAINHGKITVNYLTSLGIKRDEAEHLRENLVSHNLLKFNERNEAVVTPDGMRSFNKLAKN